MTALCAAAARSISQAMRAGVAKWKTCQSVCVRRAGVFYDARIAARCGFFQLEFS